MLVTPAGIFTVVSPLTGGGCLVILGPGITIPVIVTIAAIRLI